jgi:hypothetical protein
MTRNSKTVAIVQSCYIPWRGFFDLMKRVDEFVLFDDVQYTRRDWRNRNQIKTAQGLKWLTIPVDVKGKYHQKIKETRIADPEWAANHWQTIRHAYAKAAGFSEFGPVLEELYLGCEESMLSMVNYHFLTGINRMLDIQTRLSWSSDYQLEDEKSDRLLSICKQAGATHYLSGPSAKSYLDENLFRHEGVEVVWMDYSGYPEYRQLYPPFEPHVSIVDLLLNEGVNAREFVGTPADV